MFDYNEGKISAPEPLPTMEKHTFEGFGTMKGDDPGSAKLNFLKIHWKLVQSEKQFYRSEI